MILHSPKTCSETGSTMPSGFRSFANGRLLIREDYVERFRERGWLNASHVIDADDVNVFRRLSDRENGIVLWGDEHGSQCRSFIKRHTNPKKSKRRWNRSILPPAGLHEGWASEECRKAGVGVAPVIAVGEEEMGKACSRSFFMSEELSGFLPADDFAVKLEHLHPSDPRRRAFIHSLADLTRKLHAANLFHRDYYWCHLFVRETAEARFDVRLIDLQRVDRPMWRHLRWRIKDLAQFVFSAPTGFLAEPERADWFCRYLGRAELYRADRLLLSTVEIRAAIYRWREANR